MRVFSGLLVALAVAGPAAADIYECRFRGDSSWVPEVVRVEIGRVGDEVRVNDPLIAYFLKAPTKATVETDNAARTTFTWNYRVKNDRNQYARLNFRMTRLKASASATISVRAIDYVGPFTGQGACNTLKGRL